MLFAEQADRLPPGPGPAHDRGQFRHTRLHQEGSLIPAFRVGRSKLREQPLAIDWRFRQYAVDGLVGLRDQGRERR